MWYARPPPKCVRAATGRPLAVYSGQKGEAAPDCATTALGAASLTYTCVCVYTNIHSFSALWRIRG